MQKRIRTRKFILLALFLFIAITLVTLVVGQSSMSPIIVVSNSTGINPAKTLDQQTSDLSIEYINTADLAKLGPSVITNAREIKGYYLSAPVSNGEPLFASDLSKTLGGSPISTQLPMTDTYFLIPMADTASIPPGLTPGDRLDVDALVQVPATSLPNGGSQASATAGQQVYVSGILVKDALITSINQAGIEIEVTQKQLLELSIAAKIGSFIFEIPGQEKIPVCTTSNDSTRVGIGDSCYETQDGAGEVTQGEVISQLENNPIEIPGSSSTSGSNGGNNSQATGGLFGTGSTSTGSNTGTTVVNHATPSNAVTANGTSVSSSTPSSGGGTNAGTTVTNNVIPSNAVTANGTPVSSSTKPKN